MTSTHGRVRESEPKEEMPRPPFGAVDGTWNPSGRRRLVSNEELERMRPLIPTIASSFPSGLQRMLPDAPLENVLAFTSSTIKPK